MPKIRSWTLRYHPLVSYVDILLIKICLRILAATIRILCSTTWNTVLRKKRRICLISCSPLKISASLYEPTLSIINTILLSVMRVIYSVRIDFKNGLLNILSLDNRCIFLSLLWFSYSLFHWQGITRTPAHVFGRVHASTDIWTKIVAHLSPTRKWWSCVYAYSTSDVEMKGDVLNF